MTQWKFLVLGFFAAQMVSTSASADSFEDLYSSATMKGEIVSVHGQIVDTPKFRSGYGGKYENWTFKVSTDPKTKSDDIIVTCHTVKWGKKVGECNFKRNQFVTLKGQYLSKENNTRPVNAMYLNNLALRDIASQ